MLIYLATTTFHYTKEVYDYHLLSSFYYITETIAKTIPRYKSFMLDSGIFTYLNSPEKGENFDWQKYANQYGNFVKKHNIRNYIEIDVDRFLGLDEVERLRRYLEGIVGWKCMPVWHMNRGWDKWLEICRDYRYICFGAFITDNLRMEKYKYIPAFLREAARQGTKVHGLGFTRTLDLIKYKFYSVDSSTWQGGARFGQTFMFQNGTIKQFRREKNKRATKVRELTNHNLREWIKFSEYAEHNL